MHLVPATCWCTASVMARPQLRERSCRYGLHRRIQPNDQCSCAVHRHADRDRGAFNALTQNPNNGTGAFLTLSADGQSFAFAGSICSGMQGAVRRKSGHCRPDGKWVD